jgi:hypothetical protein
MSTDESDCDGDTVTPLALVNASELLSDQVNKADARG